MKKIGIITFHRAKNYGAVLQAYALQHTLKQLGSDCEIVDYKCENIDNGYKPFQFSKTDPIKSILKSIVMYRKRAKKIEQFSSFYNNYLKISNKTYSNSDISECKNLYDAFISGSDQVWGPGKEGINPDSIYFLSFADDNQKYSYAASFGVADISDVKAMQLRPLLKNFQSFSVREKSGADIIENLIDRKAEISIDPSLLLTEDDWDKISRCPVPKEPYIFLFSVRKPIKLISYALELSKKTGYKIYYLQKERLHKIDGIEYLDPVNATEFVGLIKNAEYICTNSFHGTAFSVIYKKNFAVELQHIGGRNIRAEELLNNLGINDREITNDVFPNINGAVNWERVDNVLLKERNKSKEYINKIKELIQNESSEVTV